MVQEITNEDLTLDDIPEPTARWGEIGRFALTFNGYERLGSFEACAAIANECRHDSLTNARACLFFEQRRWRHFGGAPSGREMAYIRELVQRIREFVASA